MWRQAKDINDAVLILETCEAAEPTLYNSSVIKRALHFKSNQLVNKNFVDSNEQWWIYEDGAKKIIIALENRPGDTPRIMRVCAVGFGGTTFENCKEYIPIVGDKVREVMDAWGVQVFTSKAPRTDKGECEVYFIQAYVGEATVKLSDDEMSYEITYDRTKKLPEEGKFKVISTPTVEANAVPADHVLEDLKNV